MIGITIGLIGIFLLIGVIRIVILYGLSYVIVGLVGLLFTIPTAQIMSVLLVIVLVYTVIRFMLEAIVILYAATTAKRYGMSIQQRLEHMKTRR